MQIRSSRRAVTRNLAVVIVIAIILAAVAAAGWTLDLTHSSQVTTSSNTSSNQSLVDQAKAECAGTSTCLTIYSTADLSEWQVDEAPTFFAAYPWANGKVDYETPNAAALTSEAISDFKTGKVQADIFSATLGIVIPIIQAGAVMNYTDPVAQYMNYSSSTYDPNGAYYTIGYSLVVMMYNPHVIPASEAPQTYANLSNPIYKGKIVFQSAASLSATTGVFYYLYTQMGNSSGQWTNLMKAIAANSPVITPSAGDAEADVASGQDGVCICLYNDYLSAIQSGSTNVTVVVPNPTVFNPQVLSIAMNAPHPAMAELFQQWFLGEAGQVGHALSGRTPLDLATATYYGLIPKNVTLADAYTNPLIWQNVGGWSDTFKTIYGA